MSADPNSFSNNIQLWKRRFAKAADEGEVLAMAREFIGALPPEVRSAIQAPVDAVPFRNSDEVLEFAVHLTQLEMSLPWDEVSVGRTVRAVGSLFIDAGKRLTALSEARVLHKFDETRSEGQSRD